MHGYRRGNKNTVLTKLKLASRRTQNFGAKLGRSKLQATVAIL